MDQVGRTNPWAKESTFPRTICVPCQDRGVLAVEADEEALEIAGTASEGQDSYVRKKRPEDKVALSSCRGNGGISCAGMFEVQARKNLVYVLQIYLHKCLPESYGTYEEITEGVLSHPLVVYFWREHLVYKCVKASSGWTAVVVCYMGQVC